TWSTGMKRSSQRVNGARSINFYGEKPQVREGGSAPVASLFFRLDVIEIRVPVTAGPSRRCTGATSRASTSTPCSAVQLLHAPVRPLPEELRGGAGRLPGAERRGPGHQVDRPRPLGRRRPDAHHVVPAPRGAGGHRPRGALGPRPARRL